MQQKEPTSHPSQRAPSSRKRSPQNAHASQPPQTPPVLPPSALHTPEEWRAHWKAQGQPWRTKPEIDAQRQAELTKCRAIVPDIGEGIYPFGGMKLTRADIEWLLATHENGRGPVDWSDKSQRGREGLDMRGADLRGSENQREALAGLPLARLVGGLNPAKWWDALSKKQRKLASVMLTGADLRGAQLEGAELSGAQLDRTCLSGAQLEEADLSYAQLK